MKQLFLSLTLLQDLLVWTLDNTDDQRNAGRTVQ